jgi:DNA-directed RNA polymerase specialized sigma24 family protein
MQDLRPSETAHEDAFTALVEVRPRLFAIAYRMLASVAEDIIQDVWLRWQAADRVAGQKHRFTAVIAYRLDSSGFPSKVALLRVATDI